MQESLNSPEFRKQINLANSPEFRQQMGALNKQTRDLTRNAMKLQFDNSPEWQNLQKQLREMKIPDITKDHSYQTFLASLKTQTDALNQSILNSPQMKAQIAEARRLGQLDRTDRANELAQASASIAEARKTATDDATRKQLDQAQAALDRARKPLVLNLDPTNAPTTPKP